MRTVAHRRSLLPLTLALAAGAFLTIVRPPAGGEPAFDFSAADLFPDENENAFAPPGAAAADSLVLRLENARERVAPGRLHPLALHLQLPPRHYTYWTHPGELGKSPALTWTLPPGFTVESVRWPAPRRKESAGAIAYALEGDVVAFVLLRAPDALPVEASYEVAVSADVLVCERTCTFLTRTARVTLTTETGPPGPSAPDDPDGVAVPDRAPYVDLWARLPAPPPPDWRFEARRVGASLQLAIHPPTGSPSRSPGTVDFFESTFPGGLVDPIPTPSFQPSENGGGVLTLSLAADAPPVDTLRGVLTVSRGWTGPSVPSAWRLAIPLDGTSAAPPNADAAGFRERWFGFSSGARARPGEMGWMLLFAFLGGAILNVMPCVFPVLSLKVMSMVRHAHQEHRAVFWHGIAYAAGVLICFWIIAFAAIAVGGTWGVQLGSPWFIFVMGHVFVVIALNMAGVFEVGALDFGAAAEKAHHQTGVKHSFFTGVLATLTSTPCSAPFLGTALSFALVLPRGWALVFFTAMALGFALPYLFLALFPACLRRLPKPGAWMETFRRVMAFPLFGTALYMAWIYAGLSTEGGFLRFLLGLVGIAFACWLYGHGQNHPRPRRRLHPMTLAAALVLVASVAWSRPREDALTWEPWSPERVAELRAEGRPVWVDFTARWCATCQANKWVFGQSRVTDALRQHNVALLKADWTHHDPRITQTLRHEFDRAAVPVNAVYWPGVAKARLLPDLLNPGNVLDALAPPPE